MWYCLDSRQPRKKVSCKVLYRAGLCLYEQGDTLCEVETEEKIVPLKAERDGVCATYLLEEGTTICIGDALFVRNDCLALKGCPSRKTIKQIPARFGVELKNCLRCALEKDPRDRATCEEMFYLLEPSRAQRRHNVVELRPKIAQLLDLGTGGYEEEALPLAGRIDRGRGREGATTRRRGGGPETARGGGTPETRSGEYARSRAEAEGQVDFSIDGGTLHF